MCRSCATGQLAAALRDRLGIPIATVNDGSAAALGELNFGAGRGLERFVVVTFGTGVGGGVVVDGRVITGADGEPPEIGAMVLDAAAKSPRTLEEFACAAGFTSAYQRQGGQARLPPQDIFARAASGEEAASRAIEETCRRIAQGLGTLINILNLQACLIGGGIAQAGRPLLDPIRRQPARFHVALSAVARSGRTRGDWSRRGNIGCCGVGTWLEGECSLDVSPPMNAQRCGAQLAGRHAAQFCSVRSDAE